MTFVMDCTECWLANCNGNFHSGWRLFVDLDVPHLKNQTTSAKRPDLRPFLRGPNLLYKPSIVLLARGLPLLPISSYSLLFSAFSSLSLSSMPHSHPNPQRDPLLGLSLLLFSPFTDVRFKSLIINIIKFMAFPSAAKLLSRGGKRTMCYLWFFDGN